MSRKRPSLKFLLFLFVFTGLGLSIGSLAQEPLQPPDDVLPDSSAVDAMAIQFNIDARQLHHDESQRFTHDTEDEAWRYVSDLGTHRPTPLTAAAENGQIAYVGNDGYLRLMNPGGTAQRRILDDLPNVNWPRWSPDSQYLAFTAEGETGRCLYKLRLNNLAYTRLVCGFADIVTPDWSPQSSRIAFYGEQEDGTGYQAWALNADGSGLTELAPELDLTGPPVWVDEDRIAFPGENPTQVWKLYVVDFDQPDDPQSITPEFTSPPWCGAEGAQVAFPDVSPDGQQIAFHGVRIVEGFFTCTAYLGLYLVDPAGASPPSRIVEFASSHSNLVMGMLKWAPDNQRVGVYGGSEHKHRLNVIDTISGDRTVFPYREGTDAGALDWAPDGTQLAVGYAPSGSEPTVESVDPVSQVFTVLAYGKRPAWGTLPPVPPSTTDLSINHIEVTQGLQDWDQTVRLIEGKPTFARVYVDATVDTAGVRAHLLGTLDGQSLGEPEDPLNPGHQIFAQAGGGDRADLDDSFYFHLPDSWLVEGVKLTAYVDPDREIPETKENNNTAERVLPQFVATDPVHIVLVPVIHVLESTKLPHFSDAHRAATWLEHTYPIEDLVLHHSWRMLVGCPLDKSGCYTRLIFRLGLRGQILSGCINPGFCLRDRRVVYGIVHQDVAGSLLGAGNKSTRSSWGRVGRSVPPFAVDDAIIDTDSRRHYGRIMAHEVGHTFGLGHQKPMEPDPECLDVTEGVEKAPYPLLASIGVPTDTKSYYGFDSFESPPEIYESTARDMMTYCYDRYWISYGSSTTPGSFDRLLRRTGATSQSTRLEATFSDDQLWLAASGIVTPTTGSLELLPFYVLPDLSPSYDPQPGDYSIELYDAGDGLLVSHPFTLTYPTTSLPSGPRQVQTQSDPPALFLQVLPFDPATAYIHVKRSDAVLSVVPVSAHSPQVTVTHPNGGEVLSGTVSVTWSTDDEDSDVLSYAVRYSPDVGTTWTALAVDLSDEIYELDTSRLPGTDQGVIQVIATDGVNTTTDSSDAPFTVPAKIPVAYISLPADGSTLQEGTSVPLVGSAYDPEDGPLEGSRLTWTSSLDGDLGTGELLFAQGLSRGGHTITLTARDGEGNDGSASIRIRLGIEIYLPLVMREG